MTDVRRCFTSVTHGWVTLVFPYRRLCPAREPYSADGCVNDSGGPQPCVGGHGCRPGQNPEPLRKATRTCDQPRRDSTDAASTTVYNDGGYARYVEHFCCVQLTSVSGHGCFALKPWYRRDTYLIGGSLPACEHGIEIPSINSGIRRSSTPVASASSPWSHPFPARYLRYEGG